MMCVNAYVATYIRSVESKLGLLLHDSQRKSVHKPPESHLLLKSYLWMYSDLEWLEIVQRVNYNCFCHLSR